jgi:hypothetical protein
MSEVKFNEENKSGKIVDAKFAYVRLDKPTPKFKKDQGTEYSVAVVVDKTSAKILKKRFPKNSVKEIDTPDFEQAYKFPAPFPDQDEQFVFTFRADSHYKDGKEKEYRFTSRPKVYVPSKVEEGKVEDVTLSLKVGNGSGGDVAFTIKQTDEGDLHSLIGILVKDLVVSDYKPKGINAFGEVVEKKVEGKLEDSSESDTEVPF